MVAEVIVDILNSNVDRIFDYSVPFNVNYQVGQRVLVPFGNRKVDGYIINFKDSSNVEAEKLKSIIKPQDEFAVIVPEMFELSKFLVKEYNLKLMDTLRLFIPSGMRKNRAKQKFVKMCSLNKNADFTLIKKTAKNQAKAVEFLKENSPIQITALNKSFGSASINGLIEKSIIVVTNEKAENEVVNYGEVEQKKFKLTSGQENAIKTIENSKKPVLLFGVTGSGKTEVYMRVIEDVIKAGKTAIMLVPEISLTPQIFRNFNSRFNSLVAILHSGLSTQERYDEWKRIFDGKAKIVVGARSAIFAPLANLGVIIIDEEHDTSYYSETNPRYFTHSVAKFRANYNKCPLVFGSATPSIDSFYKAKNGEYVLAEMPIRVNDAPMPKFQIVDMLSEIRNGNGTLLSNAMLSELKTCLDNKKQAILFLNRRGYNSFVMCRECGYVAKCEDCDVPLVYHKEDNELKCHYCSRRYKMLTECPNCHSKYIKYGAIGTQKVVEFLHETFPDVKIFRMDNDTTRTKNSHYKILKEFGETKPSILVGTQMIAKGHDFPYVTLVGIIDADLSLHFADFRAYERAFELITQVSGRAGRGDYEGKIVLQTYSPKHFVYKFASNYDYLGFYKKEINLREVTNFPPFAMVVRVLFSGTDEQKVKEFLKVYYEKIVKIKVENAKDFIYLNAMKSPVKRIKTKFRYQVLMRIKPNNFQKIVEELFKIDNTTKSKDVIVFIEINPQNLS